MLLTPGLRTSASISAPGLFQLGRRRRCSGRTFRELGGFPEDGRRSDMLFWIHACARVNVLLVPGDLFYYRIHPDRRWPGRRTPSRYAQARAAAWRMLNSTECPLRGDVLDQREDATFLQAAGARDATGSGAARFAAAAAAIVRYVGLASRDWVRYLRRPPNRSANAGTPADRENRSSARLVLPDSVGGTEVYVEGLCRRLRAAGHEVLHRGARRARRRRRTLRARRRARVPLRDSRRADARRGAPSRRRSAAPNASTLAGRASVPTSCTFTASRPASGCRRSAKRARLGIRVIATCHLPGLGYMCRTGELMQWGRVPCDGIVVAGQVRVVQPDAARDARGRARACAGAVPVPLGAPLARDARPSRDGARDERVGRRVSRRCSASCSAWWTRSSC